MGVIVQLENEPINLFEKKLQRYDHRTVYIQSSMKSLVGEIIGVKSARRHWQKEGISSISEATRYPNLLLKNLP